ncbi:MAG: 16S rRNA (cytosine(1402)-N(4))-methyltransferase RsmH [Clostridia bacterium]|jgi:16S rRNA (cytosine1402-N4)-methyltransferase|nr:16S rRNA (cytosine(1402)-N(4))-methyltransferase RsmH [Clostridia bacterium]
MEFRHIPVMLGECIDGLDIKPDGVYLDCTLGGGGHSEKIVSQLQGGKLIAVDKDIEAIKSSQARLSEYKDKIIYIHDDFKNVISHLDEMGVEKLDGVLIDLGVSSYQLDNAERGFSYNADAPLDMRMDQGQYLSAKQVVNEYSQEKLADIIWQYGEDKLSRAIAKGIVEYRNKKEIETTGELAKIVEQAYPAKLRWKFGNPCKRTFQAIRIEVNGELKDLGEVIEDLSIRLKTGGRICIITFHSLEDRIVKRAFVQLNKECVCPPHQPICTCGKRREIEIVTKKPLVASDRELEENSRSSCAKLRIATRV